MLPEISHRCPSCGVSVRERDALFCPECGKQLSQQTPAESTQSTGKNSAPDENSSVEPESRPAPRPSTYVANAEKSTATTDTNEERESPRIRRPGEKTRERFHRASEVARGVTRGVIEEPAKRVEKIRQASSVVIEEASYDPSLRFVLVALGLFVMFVILLVVTKVMG